MLANKENNSIVLLPEVQKFELLQRISKAFFESGIFKDVASHAQAIVKVMAGAELNLAPFASMTGIHLVNGKPVLGANLIATLIGNHPRYRYALKKATKETCELEFYDDDEYLGESIFTIQEAQEAGLLGKDNWKKYPSDMLFARALSRGARRFTPGIFGGSTVYTPEEIEVNPVHLKHDADGVIDTDEIIIEEFKKNNVVSDHDLTGAHTC
jgi:hypothetical protein